MATGRKGRCDGGCAFPKDCWVRGFCLVQGRSIMSRKHPVLQALGPSAKLTWAPAGRGGTLAAGCAYSRHHRELTTRN